MRQRVLFLLIVSMMISCNQPVTEEAVSEPIIPIDNNATAETVALFTNLVALSETNILFGHQDDLAYGYTWWEEEGRSDVKETTGSYPAIYGWDIGDLVQDTPTNLDNIKFEKMKDWIKEGYERGGVITISWHMNNPVTDGNSWDRKPVVSTILPGGVYHEKYKSWLDKFVAFNAELVGKDGEAIPIIFRPFHEHNGSWFWWGDGLVTEQDYIALWRFTVEYLRDEQGVHNLLYSFSPDRSRLDINNFKTDYFYAYPGNDYVDIIGLDNYWDVGHPANTTPENNQQEYFIQSLTELVQLADSLGKIAALTETGSEALPESTWWTQKLAAALTTNEYTKRISYVHVWRNANKDRYQGDGDHFYASYPGHPSAPDMIEFRNMDFFLFEDELPNMYKQ